jgi:tRNA (guanine37-N1)-methyltransferase
VQISLVSIFPEMYQSLNYGIVGRAIEQKLLNIKCWNPRDFTADTHRTVDDRPYGGGPGMVMKVEPLRAAIQSAKQSSKKKTKTIYLSPQGRVLTQDAINEFATRPHLVLIAGRYEGIDERLIQTEIDEEWSIGDYVLSGGELPAMVMIDAICRLLPGALNDCESSKQDSFVAGLLDHPHYTRPEEIDGLRVPSVLTSGNHRMIEKWRLKQALGRTWLRRPDLLAKRALNETEHKLLTDFMNEYLDTSKNEASIDE